MYSRQDVCHKETKQEPNHHKQDLRTEKSQLKHDKSGLLYLHEDIYPEMTPQSGVMNERAKREGSTQLSAETEKGSPRVSPTCSGHLSTFSSIILPMNVMQRIKYCGNITLSTYFSECFYIFHIHVITFEIDKFLLGRAGDINHTHLMTQKQQSSWHWLYHSSAQRFPTPLQQLLFQTQLITIQCCLTERTT